MHNPGEEVIEQSGARNAVLVHEPVFYSLDVDAAYRGRVLFDSRAWIITAVRASS